MRADVADRVISGEPEGVPGHKRHAADSHGHLRIVVSNTVISLAGQVVTWLSTLALTMAYGRFLGPAGFGELYLAITLTGLIGFPLEFGFNQQIIREVASAPHRAQRYVSSALLLKVALWAPLCAALMIAAALLHYSPEERVVVALSGLTLLVTSIGAAFGAMQIAVHRNIVPVSGLIVEKVLDAAVAFLLLRFLHVGVIPVAVVLLVGASLNASWQAFWFYRLERPIFALDLATIREIVYTSVPFLLYGALGVIYYRIDTVLLGALDGDAVVGRYGAGYKIFDTLIFLPGLIMSTVMYPLMARLSTDDPKAFRVAIEKSMNFLLICGMPLATGLGVAAPAIVGFLYHHEEFARTTLVMEALAPGLILLYVNSVISNIIITRHREKSLVWMAAVAMVLNISLNLLLIPRYHEVAAALVTSITEAALLVMGLFAVPRDLIPLGSLPTLAKSLLASATMALVILALDHFTILVIIPAAAATYIAVGAVARLVPRADALALVAAVRRKVGRGATEAETANVTEVAEAMGSVAAVESVEITEPVPAVRVAGASVIAARAHERRSAPRSMPLAEIYAMSRPAARARLVTQAGPRSTQPPARGRSSAVATRLARRAVASQPIRARRLTVSPA
ncbi:MAG TPA: flippase [Ktedonobacterales bacterium]|nr:flippase [Ktedonobacterales bacterium]